MALSVVTKKFDKIGPWHILAKLYWTKLDFGLWQSVVRQMGWPGFCERSWNWSSAAASFWMSDVRTLARSIEMSWKFCDSVEKISATDRLKSFFFVWASSIGPILRTESACFASEFNNLGSAQPTWILKFGPMSLSSDIKSETISWPFNL